MSTFPYLLSLAVIVSISLNGTVQAADSPHFLIANLGTVSGTTTYEIDADSSSSSISAIEILVNLPSAVQYKSSDTTVGKFDTEVTPPSFAKGQYRIIRAALVKDGLMGNAIPVVRFSVTNASTLPTIDAVGSKMIRYSDSADLLHPVVNRAVVTSAAPKPATTTTSRLPITIGLGAIILVVAALLIRRRQL